MLLTKDELRTIGDTELMLTSIMGDKQRVKHINIDELDLRFGHTSWGLPMEAWEQVGQMIVKWVP